MSGPLATADAILLAMPSLLLLGGVVGWVTAVPFAVGVAGGSLSAGGAVGYALFADPPE